MRKIVLLAMALTFVAASVGVAAAAQPRLIPVPTCWMQESPAFNAWFAKKMGWDKQEGIDISMLTFDSGSAQMEALPAKQWVLGSTGVAGQLIGGLRYKIYVVAPIISEADVNALYVRPNSPILKNKGVNPKYPDIYGSPVTAKGLNILVTSQTTVHYVAGQWLKDLGLKQTDATFTNMDQPSIMAAFSKGIGDVAAIWAPYTQAAEEKGWKQIANTGTTGAYTASMIVGDKDWCDKHPEAVAKFLRVFFRVNDYIAANKNTPAFKKLYVQFLNDFCGMQLSEKKAMEDLAVHPRWTMQQAIELSDSSKGQAKAARWLDDAADFFESVGRFSPAEVKYFKDQKLVTDRFLEMAAK